MNSLKMNKKSYKLDDSECILNENAYLVSELSHFTRKQRDLLYGEIKRPQRNSLAEIMEEYRNALANYIPE